MSQCFHSLWKRYKEYERVIESMKDLRLMDECELYV